MDKILEQLLEWIDMMEVDAGEQVNRYDEKNDYLAEFWSGKEEAYIIVRNYLNKIMGKEN